MWYIRNEHKAIAQQTVQSDCIAVCCIYLINVSWSNLSLYHIMDLFHWYHILIHFHPNHHHLLPDCREYYDWEGFDSLEYHYSSLSFSCLDSLHHYHFLRVVLIKITYSILSSKLTFFFLFLNFTTWFHGPSWNSNQKTCNKPQNHKYHRL